MDSSDDARSCHRPGFTWIQNPCCWGNRCSEFLDTRILDLVRLFTLWPVVFLPWLIIAWTRRSKIIENLAVVNYDTNNLYLAPYDWRLSYYNLEERDGYFSKLKVTIEGLKLVSPQSYNVNADGFLTQAATTEESCRCCTFYGMLCMLFYIFLLQCGRTDKWTRFFWYALIVKLKSLLLPVTHTVFVRTLVAVMWTG